MRGVVDPDRPKAEAVKMDTTEAIEMLLDYLRNLSYHLHPVDAQGRPALRDGTLAPDPGPSGALAREWANQLLEAGKATSGEGTCKLCRK